MKGILERFRSKPAAVATGLSTGDLTALEKYLADLDNRKKGLGSDAYRYVLTGAGDSVLLRVASARNIHPSTCWFPTNYQERRPAERIFLELEGWDTGVVKRLGEVIAVSLDIGATASGFGKLLPGTAESPAFFRALLHVGASCLQRVSSEAPRYPSWMLSGPRCIDLLALDGADQTALVNALFADLEHGKWYSASRTGLLTMADLAEVLAQAPERTLMGARALDIKGRSCFIEFLGGAGIADRPEFFEFLIDAIGKGGKQESRAALSSLTGCGDSQIHDRAVQLFESERADDRRTAVLILANMGTPAARSLLERHVPEETSRTVLQAIDEVLRPLRAMEPSATIGAENGGNGYISIDGDWIAIPSAAAASPPDTPPPEGMAADLRAAVLGANREARRYFDEYQRWLAQLPPEQRGYRYGPKDYVAPYSVEAIPEFLDVVIGRVDPRSATVTANALCAVWSGFHHTATRQYSTSLERILTAPGVTPHHLARIAALHLGTPSDWARSLLTGVQLRTPAERLLSQLAISDGDFRPVLQICTSVGCGPESFVAGLLCRRWARFLLDEIETHRDLLWPVVAEQTDILDQALGLAPAPPDSSFHINRALDLLAILPAPPRRYLQVLLDIAVGGLKDAKVLARSILSSTRSVTELILPLLDNGEQARRIGAADWLRQRRDRQAIPALRAALDKEKTDAGRAAFLTALMALGDDVSDQFSEKRLLAEARAGLSKARSKVGDCVPLDHLPALAWQDGRRVPAEVVRWWVVLGGKLKNARGNPLLNIALDRLERSSAERLAIFMMSSFIAYDTRRPTDEEANAYAEANADLHWQTYRKWHPTFRREQAFATLKSQRLRQYFQSAIDHRGILALARGAPANEAVNIVKIFFRDHYARTQQCKVLLDGLSNNLSAVALQFVLGISMRYRTPGVRKHAADLMNAIAEDRGWTRDELSDRTVPTGGLDETGVLHLPVGEKTYLASLGPDLKAVLRNPDGKIVQTLPSGDEDATAAAKKAFSNLKKEVKQTLHQQTARLYEAMCAERIWPSVDIGIYLFRHPIIGRLCQRLVFAGLDQDGQVVETFRPLGDGSLTNALDEPIDIAAFAGVRVAHSALLDEARAKAWQRHLSDYEITPLFGQLARPFLGPDPARAAETAITEREGFMLDTFTLRGAATKLGYQRGQSEDGGFVTTYQKSFPTADRVALIEFTGSRLPEDNNPCALIGLSFVRDGGGSARDKALALSAVPPVLLSETWHDLRAIAAAGAGFDPEWRKKVQW